jgi:hypothetical protein
MRRMESGFVALITFLAAFVGYGYAYLLCVFFSRRGGAKQALARA